MKTHERDELLQVLKARFEQNPQRHEGIAWDDVRARLESNSGALNALQAMETTGGEPDVIGQDEDGRFTFCDCAAESPTGRRSLCYDREALESRKENRPKGSAVEMAEAMRVDLLTEGQYRELQQLGEFDLKTSSWVETPPELRALGSDSSERALAAARHNTQLADASLGGRLSPSIAWLHGDVLGVMEQVPQGAFVLTNPPYGKRLPGGRPRAGPPTSRPSQVHPAVLQFLSVLERRPDLRPVVMLLGGEARHVLPSSAPALFRTQNGGLPVSARLLRGPGEP